MIIQQYVQYSNKRLTVSQFRQQHTFYITLKTAQNALELSNVDITHIRTTPHKDSSAFIKYSNAYINIY